LRQLLLLFFVVSDKPFSVRIKIAILLDEEYKGIVLRNLCTKGG